MKHITTERTDSVFDVYEMPKGDLVLAAYDGLYHLENNGNYHTHIDYLISFEM